MTIIIVECNLVNREQCGYIEIDQCTKTPRCDHHYIVDDDDDDNDNVNDDDDNHDGDDDNKYNNL